MHIEQIRVQNFRILKDCTLDMRNDLRPNFLPVFGRVFIVSLINGDSTKKWRKLRGAGQCYSRLDLCAFSGECGRGTKNWSVLS